MTHWKCSLRMDLKNIVFIPDNINFETVTRSWLANDWKDEGGRFITTPHVWYRLSDLQKRTRAVLLFRKCKSSRDSGDSRCRAGINWEEWAGDGDDIQIRGAENDKNIHMTRTLHISRVIGWYSDIGELSFAFILHRAKGHFARENRKTPVSIIQISVITSRIARRMTRQTIGSPLTTVKFANGICMMTIVSKIAICPLDWFVFVIYSLLYLSNFTSNYYYTKNREEAEWHPVLQRAFSLICWQP